MVSSARETPMTKQEFDEAIRRYLAHVPFRPFVVELHDGTSYVIPLAKIMVHNGEACYLSPTDGGLVEINHGEVRAIVAVQRNAFGQESTTNSIREPSMTRQEFEDTLRQFLRRIPFQPFVVDLSNGEAIQVLDNHVAFGGGAATFFTPEFDLIEFTCENVESIHTAEMVTR
jgi:hypothetical protein